MNRAGSPQRHGMNRRYARRHDHRAAIIRIRSDLSRPRCALWHKPMILLTLPSGGGGLERGGNGYDQPFARVGEVARGGGYEAVDPAMIKPGPAR